MDFNFKSRYGNVINTYVLKQAFSDEWTILLYDRLSNLYNTILDKNDYFKIAVYHIKTELINLIDLYGKEKELINNHDAFADIYKYANCIEKVNSIINIYVKKFKIPRKEIINYIYNEEHYTTVRYKGWCSNVMNKNKIDKPIKFYLDPSKWHTEKERSILDFKSWKYKYFNIPVNVNRYGKTYDQIYNDLELKKEFEVRADKLVIQHKANVLYKANIKQEEELAKSQKELNNWLAGDKTYNLYNIPIHLRIKNGRIETTRNAIIPFESGKKLFKLFNKIRQDNNILIYNAKPDEVSVGNYSFRNIEYINSRWYVTVGCHKLRDTEIDLFINSNNLQDWL